MPIDWSNPFEIDWHRSVMGGKPDHFTIQQLMSNIEAEDIVVVPREMLDAILGMQLVYGKSFIIRNWDSAADKLTVIPDYSLADVYYPYNPIPKPSRRDFESQWRF